MNEPKNWYESKGVIGPIAALIATLIQQFGEKVGINVDRNQVTEGLVQIIIIGGILFGIWGRWYASQPIKSIKRSRKPSGQGNSNSGK